MAAHPGRDPGPRRLDRPGPRRLRQRRLTDGEGRTLRRPAPAPTVGPHPDDPGGGLAQGGPVAGGPFAGGPVAGAPVAGGPVAGGPVAGGPFAGGPVAGAPVAGGPVAELLGRCTFPPAGASLDCAVSGGADSLALLVLATAAGCDVTAHHVDHGLRPGSAGEARVVAAAAARFGARFVAHRVDVGPGPNLEARARDARRAALPAGAATGHTADDQAETVLLNLLRGAGLDGLSGMRPGPAKPLLALRRSETAAVCDAAGLVPVVDPTNADPAFRRNRVRHEVLPLLAAVAGRDVVPVLARQAALLRDEADLLDALAAVDPGDARALSALPPPLARRAVRRLLAGEHPPGSAAVERVLGVARGEAVACEVEGGRRVRRSAGRLAVDG